MLIFAAYLMLRRAIDEPTQRARQKDENLTDYIGRCLMRVKMFSKQTGVTVFMVLQAALAATPLFAAKPAGRHLPFPFGQINHAARA